MELVASKYPSVVLLMLLILATLVIFPFEIVRVPSVRSDAETFKLPLIVPDPDD
jgi:hypothetical protein